VRFDYGTCVAGACDKPTNKSWRVDETYVCIRGHWFYLYRALDPSAATIDFLLSAVRSACAAKALLSKSLSNSSHPQPRVINTDKARCYPWAISEAKDQSIYGGAVGIGRSHT
jgi:transposase, IS6 family